MENQEKKRFPSAAEAIAHCENKGILYTEVYVKVAGREYKAICQAPNRNVLKASQALAEQKKENDATEAIYQSCVLYEDPAIAANDILHVKVVEGITQFVSQIEVSLGKS